MDELLTKRRRLKLRLCVEGLPVGIATGTIVAAFRFLLDEADILRPMWLARLRDQSAPLDWALTVGVIILTARLISEAIARDGQVAGSGVPQIKGILQGAMIMTRPLRLIAVKFAAAVLAIGEGMSLGRAGLSVQFGACIGTYFNRLLGRRHIQHDQTLEDHDVISFEFARQKKASTSPADTAGHARLAVGASDKNIFGSARIEAVKKLFRAGGDESSSIEPPTVEGKFLLTAGAGAGLAAVFNAPLAGVIFCVEELHKRFSSELLLVSMTAAVTASAVVELVFGVRPVFETITPVMNSQPLVSTLPTVDMISDIASAPIRFTACFALLGAFTGVLGAMFTRALLISLDCYDRAGVKGTRRFLIPLSTALIIGLWLPEVLGCGNVLVDELLSGDFALSMLLIFFVGKFLFTMICFGTGAPGGIFLPLLVLGALSGEIFSAAASSTGIFGAEWSTLFTIFGMAGYFAAVVKAPITGSILIMELTGSFSHLLALIIVSGVAFLVSDLFGGAPAYSALLNRALHR